MNETQASGTNADFSQPATAKLLEKVVANLEKQ